MSVVTALTAQNTKEVRGIHALPPAFIEQQLDAVLSDIGADAAKTGMLFNAPTIEAVVGRLSAYGIKKIVVDPVMAAKGGDILLLEEARETLAKRLIPMAMLVTPNIPEAEVLSKKSISTEKDIHESARIIKAMGAKHVLIKGGHFKGPAKDILYDGRRFFEFSKERIHTPHTHGTGCTYSSAIATFLAMDLDMEEAVGRAKDFIHTAIRFAFPLGKGHGPTNVYAPFARDQARCRVLEALQTSLARLQEASIGHLMPEVQSNLAYALPFAETRAHVAAFPGRLVRLGETIASVRGPAFGSSRHIANIILTAMRHDLRYRSAMNIRFSETMLRQCQALGWKVGAFDRAQEPDDIKKREGSSLEWGTETVLSEGAGMPDVIYDRGDMGKEAMIRVLGRTPDEVVTKVLQLREQRP